MRPTCGRLLFVAALLVTLTGVAVAKVRLVETGSTLLYPIMTRWIGLYGALHRAMSFRAAPTGSGVGIRAATTGDAQIGASDTYLSDALVKDGRLVNIPLAVSAGEIDYNIPELRGGPALQLSGPILAGIYAGTIASWDDPLIAEINPGRSLPHHTILPVHRSDGSGDTSLFTEFLSRSTPSWDRSVHFGTDVRWPVNPRALESVGNAGVIDMASRVPYSVAYVGISYTARAQVAKLDVAALRDRDGAYVLPTDENLAASVQAAGALPADGRLSIIYRAGRATYPIVNFEYAVVRTKQTAPGMASALRDFLAWIVSPTTGNAPDLLSEVHMLPLPSQAREVAIQQIKSISGP
jgi:phosphate transport system substrate-binding protein